MTTIKQYFVCSPYSGTPEQMYENTQWAARLSRYVTLSGRFAKDGYSLSLAIAPHLLLPQFLADDGQREHCISISRELITRSMEVVVLAVAPTPGMREEMEFASGEGVPFRFVTKEEVEQWEKTFVGKGKKKKELPFDMVLVPRVHLDQALKGL
jgi:hypothetical protein